MKAERSEKQSSWSLEFLPLPMLRPNDTVGRLSLQTVLLLRLHPQTALSSCLLPPCIPLSTQPNYSCLHLSSAGIKGVGSQVLGSPLCDLCFSFRLDQFLAAQGGLELTEPAAFVSQVLGLKVCTTTA